MWIQKFKIFKETGAEGLTTLVKVSDTSYENQRLAFQWIDEEGNKEEKYVLLPVIIFDIEATS